MISITMEMGWMIGVVIINAIEINIAVTNGLHFEHFYFS